MKAKTTCLCKWSLVLSSPSSSLSRQPVYVSYVRASLLPSPPLHQYTPSSNPLQGSMALNSSHSLLPNIKTAFDELESNEQTGNYVRLQRQRLTLEQCRLYSWHVEECTAEKDERGTDDYLTAAAGPCVSLQTRQVATQLLQSQQHVHIAPVIHTQKKSLLKHHLEIFLLLQQLFSHLSRTQ